MFSVFPVWSVQFPGCEAVREKASDFLSWILLSAQRQTLLNQMLMLDFPSLQTVSKQTVSSHQPKMEMRFSTSHYPQSISHSVWLLLVISLHVCGFEKSPLLNYTSAVPVVDAFLLLT